MHSFPNDPAQRQVWVDFVRRDRNRDWTPANGSRICSLHFGPDCYRAGNHRYLLEFGIEQSKKQYLEAEAVPTLMLASPASLLERLLLCYRIQQDFLTPAVSKVWVPQQQALLEQLKWAGVKLAGDSRADSPGYTSKYGTYSLLERTVNRLVDVMLVESNEVASSNHMELEGLKRAQQHLDDSGVPVHEVVTDRHAQINAADCGLHAASGHHTFCRIMYYMG
ncbi:hypothetical protein HPB52_021390 [Rhipicephalus sanguineus]|uniref:THAP-type domain-containing protein n=1 Tax=Rhipicephalus sanguineus TaxID=34632 RepID=A0A9D4STC8_RHISA|nr:hypothetical protein HPB52_021390 [Rhipicephalus sanguineus]